MDGEVLYFRRGINLKIIGEIKKFIVDMDCHGMPKTKKCSLSPEIYEARLIRAFLISYLGQNALN
jgi:hypothetical protein